EAIIAGLCKSPLTFQAIIIWRDELNEGKVFLRDIIDLEATYAGPDAKAMPAPVMGPDGQPIVAAPGAPPVPGSPVLAQTPAPPAAPPGATPFKGAPERANGEDGEGGEVAPGEGDFDDDDMENSLSLAGSRRSTTSPTPTSGCAACRTRTSRTSCATIRSRPRRSAATKNS